jgi:hypothetical protein
MPAPPWRSRNRKPATLSRLADQRGAQPMQVSPEGLKWMSPRSRSTLHRVRSALEELGYSGEERPAELEIMPMEDEPPFDGEKVLVGAPR